MQSNKVTLAKMRLRMIMIITGAKLLFDPVANVMWLQDGDTLVAAANGMAKDDAYVALAEFFSGAIA